MTDRTFFEAVEPDQLDSGLYMPGLAFDDYDDFEEDEESELDFEGGMDIQDFDDYFFGSRYLHDNVFDDFAF